MNWQLVNRIDHPHTIHMDGEVINLAAERRARIDSEKVTINLGYVDLGRVDLLVNDGFYANRSDFIRTAIRNQLDRHQEATTKAIVRRQLDLGISFFGRADLEKAQAAGEMLEIRVLGLATIASDVTPDLALATISSVCVLGALHASTAVKTALADRIK